MQIDSYKKLLNYSFWLLGRRDYTKKEMSQRLSRRVKNLKLESAELAIIKVVGRLVELGYIDDSKIINSYFEYRIKARPKGKFAFLREMQKRGIQKEVAAEEWGKRNIDEKILAQELIDKKARLIAKLPTEKRKQKIAQLLAASGFSGDIVWGILDDSRLK